MINCEKNGKHLGIFLAALMTFAFTPNAHGETALTTYCSQEAVTYSNNNNPQNNVPTITSIHVSETGLVVGVCLRVTNAMLAIYDSGTIELVERQAGANISYYGSGSRQGEIASIGGLGFDYFPNSGSSRSGKIRNIGNLSFDYHPNSGSSRSGKIRNIGSFNFDYYPDGDRHSGKIQRIGRVYFQYLSNGRMQSQGQLPGVKIIIR